MRFLASSWRSFQQQLCLKVCVSYMIKNGIFKKNCYCSVKAWKSQGSWSPRLVTEALKYQLISCTNKNVVNGLAGVGIPKTLIMEETLLQILVVVMMKMQLLNFNQNDIKYSNLVWTNQVQFFQRKCVFKAYQNLLKIKHGKLLILFQIIVFSKAKI